MSASPSNEVLAVLAATREILTTAQIAEATGLPRKKVVPATETLRRRKLAERTAAGRYRATPAGRSLAESGKRVTSGPTGPHTGRPAPRRNPLRGRAWRAMRRAGKFSVPDIARLVATGDERSVERNLHHYFSALRRAGYIAELPRREPGTKPTSNGFKRWILVRDTGPRPPVLRRRSNTLFDPNTDETFDLTEGKA